MGTQIPEAIKVRARAAATEGARGAMNVLLHNETRVAYSTIEMDGEGVGVVLVALDPHASRQLIEFAARELGATHLEDVG